MCESGVPEEEDLLGIGQGDGGDGWCAVGVATGLAGVAPAVDQQVVGVVRDATITMYAAIVTTANLALAVVVRVSILGRVGHVAEARRHVAGQVHILADEPVRGCSAVEAVRVGVELGAAAQNVGEGLVECAGLVLVDQVGRAVGDPVGCFMGHHVEGTAQLAEHAAIAVAVDEVGPVPEGVVVVPAVVCHRPHGCVAAVHGPVEPECLKVVVGDVGVVLGIDQGGVAWGFTVAGHQVPVVIPVRHVVQQRRFVACVVGRLAAVGGEEVVVGAAEAVT